MSEITLLFVDDEERILRSLAPLFRGRYRVLTTTDAREALAILLREQVHVIISDQRMPLMLGAELLRKAREISPGTMRILLTGYSDIEAAIAAVNDGEIFRYLSKPWNTQSLKETVAEAAEIALHSAASPAAETLPATVSPSAAINVLVIDDDVSTVHTIRDIAREACGGECELHWVNNLEEATELLGREDIGLVVTELSVDGEDATTTIKTLKRYRPNVVTVVLTGFRDNVALIDLINQGQIYRFLPKPVSRGLFGRSIQSALHHHRRLRAAPQLSRRHTVQPSAHEQDNTLPTRLRGFIDRIRKRPEASAVGGE